MNVRIHVFLTGLAKLFSTPVFMLLVTGEIDVLVAVLAYEVVLADVLLNVVVETMLTPKHSMTVVAEMPLVLNTLLQVLMAFFADVLT